MFLHAAALLITAPVQKPRANRGWGNYGLPSGPLSRDEKGKGRGKEKMLLFTSKASIDINLIEAWHLCQGRNHPSVPNLRVAEQNKTRKERARGRERLREEEEEEKEEELWRGKRRAWKEEKKSCNHSGNRL